VHGDEAGDGHGDALGVGVEGRGRAGVGEVVAGGAGEGRASRVAGADADLEGVVVVRELQGQGRDAAADRGAAQAIARELGPGGERELGEPGGDRRGVRALVAAALVVSGCVLIVGALRGVRRFSSQPCCSM
jgi:hypothetical protein